MIERPLPSNTEAEWMILSSLYRGVSPADVPVSDAEFSLEKNRRLFTVLCELHKTGQELGPMTLSESLQKRGWFESTGGLTGLMDLISCPEIVNLEPYIRVVQEKAILRRAITKYSALMDRCFMAQESATDLLAEAEQFVRQEQQAERGQDPLESYGQTIERLGGIGGLQDSADPGMPSPWPAIDRLLGGFRRQEITILAARPSVGKSCMAQSICNFLADRGVTVVTFSLEMSKKQLVLRAICSRARVGLDEFRKNQLTPEQRIRWAKATREISRLPFYTDDVSRTSAAIVGLMRRWKHRYPSLGMVCIDHLNLMRQAGKGSENRNRELDEMTADVKQAAKDLDLHVLGLCQLSRGSEKEKRAPGLADLRDSGGLEQNADNIAFLSLELNKERQELLKHRRYGNQDDAPVPVDFLLAKQRDGIRHQIVELWFFGKYYTFREAADEMEAAA